MDSEFAEYYCADNGRPSVPIRKMVGMMLLKNIYNLSDEGVVARWMEGLDKYIRDEVFKVMATWGGDGFSSTQIESIKR